MKKNLIMILVITLCFGAFMAGCGNNDKATESDKISESASTESETVQNSEGVEAAEKSNTDEATQNIENKAPAENSEISNSNNADSGNSSGNTSGNTSGSINYTVNGNAAGGDTPADPMNWPDNQYTKVIPKPTNGIVEKTGLKDGIYSMLLTGADEGYAKEYAAELLNAGFTENMTETNSDGLYLFGGGNSSGIFVVVEYQKGNFMIGVQL